ncbi:piggyBac transposable element-derived protein 3-like [Ischnura elegans]|uniref:piggyBac transposable element-derived protein 3-like n=1 Tax=Ischnura elegans TaxID=197161 RepID=UPI001ED8A9D6|nr:piggyBac transposable element-derived protein 3-like [Ischnura elegans]
MATVNHRFVGSHPTVADEGPVAELQSDLHNDNLDDADIILIPEEDGDVTEEESGDETVADMNNLPPRILRSQVEIGTHSYTSVNDDSGESSIESVPSDVGGTTVERKPPKKKIKGARVQRNWTSVEKNFVPNGRGDSEQQVNEVHKFDMSPVQCFESMYGDEIISYIVKMSNLYALHRNHTLNLTSEELKVYIAVLLLTGYLTPKYIRMFWETKSDTHNNLIANCIRRNRFFEIQKYLHLCDNMNLPSGDKFGKVREYFRFLNKNVIENFKYVASSHISIDETMVPYYGRHSTKQHMHGKPLRFGYKLWSCATRLGYLVSFEPYQGAKAAQHPLQPKFGLSGAVVLEMQSRLPSDFGPYNLYFDNFFSSFPLISRLTELNTGGTGTIRENRLDKCPLEPSPMLKKKKRGSFSLKVTCDLSVVKWHDNSIVTIASNCHSASPVSAADRVGVVQGKR